jgi:hypothetical protein
LLFVAACAWAAPRSAAAQDARLIDRLPPTTAQAVQRIADSVRLDSIPSEPLIKKALEGQSKGADSAHIVSAVRALAANLATARHALGTSAGEAELVAGAAALRAGATAPSLAALKDLRKRGPLAVPLSVYADLLTSGMTPDRAWEAVRELASRDVPDSEFLALRDRMAGRTAPASAPLPPGPLSPDQADPAP